jgi:capsular exopolysaccharide synthesis family protein
MEFNTEQFYNNKSDVSPYELLQRNLKYIPWILLSVFLSGLLAFIYLRYTPDLYSANGQMIIRNENPINSEDEKFNRLFLNDAGPNLTNEMAILKSTSFIQRVIERKNWNIIYEGIGKVRSAQLYEDNPLKLEVLGKKDSVVYVLDITVLDIAEFQLSTGEKYKFGETFTLPNQGVFRLQLINKQIDKFETLNFTIKIYPLDLAAELMVPNLEVKLVTDMGSIIGISFQSMNKLLASDFVNELMVEYQQLTVEDKSSIAKNTIDFIDERLDSLKSELSGVEMAIQRFQEKSESLSPVESSTFLATNSRELETRYAEMQNRIQILKWLQEYISKADNNASTVPVNLGVDEPTLGPLITAYNDLQLKKATLLKSTTEQNPIVTDLAASIEKLRRDIQEALKSVGNSYAITSSQIAREISSTKKKAIGIPGQARQLLNIERQQKIKEELYLFLLSKKEEVAIGASAVVTNASILEKATIRAKLVAPLPKSVFMKFLLAGLFLPVFIIAIINLLNDKIKFRSDIEKIVDVPVVGEVSRSDDPNPLLVTLKNRTFITEQFRTIRTNMAYMLSSATKPVILVTSSMSGEGKSFLSTNIAAAFALASRKTLILEFDIRKPKIAANLGLGTHKGLTSFLIGHGELPNLVKKVDGLDNLYIMPCGLIPPNPAELMLLPAMEELFAWAKLNFDLIVIDSAPVGVVSDSITLGKFADATIFVVRQGYTVKKSLEYIQVLKQEKKLPNLSIVLNDVKDSSGYGYGYGYGYGHKKNIEVYFNEEGTAKEGIWARLFGAKR